MMPPSLSLVPLMLVPCSALLLSSFHSLRVLTALMLLGLVLVLIGDIVLLR